MTTTVTLDIFSGRPNPTWQLTAQQEDELAERLNSAKTLTAQRPSGVFGGLGYRGFIVTRSADDHRGPLRITAHEGILDHGSAGPNLVEDTGLESWLASIGTAQLPEVVSSHLSSQLAARQAFPTFAFPIIITPTCPPNHAPDAPAYNPGLWNIPSVQPYNNCYNYANDRITNTFAQPGRATGHQYTALTCPSVSAGATSDGLHSVPNFSAPLPKKGGWYVALVIWPNADFHWYRQDSVGCWSHKPGGTPVRNVDNSGHTITDPQTCNRGNYTAFCTYMVTNHSVQIS
jgi:hypothetical protein